ncbi:hypothetical protein B0H67DRAFT_553291 [Lasiosphaeris hirsuta]|uniref:RanBD1 domain-containing protein n=1 Tax=Lasiosphaeris hirsuta TaxID=260670 RepID=A0AA40DV41_9PEZI|nr:hypothetical protein B0H67DRAFT_553291 [Lasiosphaeris hirsuta]
MADDRHTSGVSEPVTTGSIKEDAETTAARRELKQTSISEKVGHDAQQSSSQEGSEDDDADLSNNKTDKAAAARQVTPDTDSGDARNTKLKEHVSSPKKKRAHAELVADGSAAGEGSGRPISTSVTQTRTEESEPEKKRPRDRESTRRRSQDGEESGGSTRSSLDIASSTKGSATGASKNKSGTTDKPKTTSASAFASSGFAKLAASTTSPFGALAAAGKPSLFGASSSGSSGSFSVLGGPKPAAASVPAPKLSFGGDASASPFAAAGLNGKGSASVFSKPFGGSFGGGGFGGSTFGGSTFGGSSLSALSTFGKPGGALKSGKPAKPFGAPDSDAEDDSENEDDDGEDTKAGSGESDKEDSKDTDKEKDEPKAPEDEKKLRLRKIVVDDGEGNEVTLLAVRAKMFLMEKGVGWKERGAGMLKVNVPRSSVEMDDFGHPEPNSFDASVLDDDEDEDESCARKNVRLIMRQDHTLRVILNTPIVPAMKFHLTQKLKAAFVLFTAFEDGEAKQVQMKLSEANATLFISLMDMIKKQLSDV